jgi:hypothetical protein
MLDVDIDEHDILLDPFHDSQVHSMIGHYRQAHMKNIPLMIDPCSIFPFFLYVLI